MVSTRQMCTVSGVGNATTQQQAAAATAESVRLSVVTRQTSSNYVLVNCSTIPAAPALASTVNIVVDAASSSQQSSLRPASSTAHNRGLLDMPIEILQRILSFESYKRIGQLRLVSQKVNSVCMYMLNSTFSKLVKQVYARLHEIKAAMPRRESARRNHPLAFECDIIETIYMRLSLLQMTFGKHIERGHCCFFAGAILDEAQSIYNNIKYMTRFERPYRVTDELFDLSTMAMEYFKDHIESTLPDLMPCFNKAFFERRISSSSTGAIHEHGSKVASLPSPPQSNMVLRKGIRKIKQGMKMYNNQLSVLRNDLRSCKRKSMEQFKQITEQQKMLNEQQKQTLEYANRLDENDKKHEELSRKFSTLLQELNKCKTELQYWRSKSPAMPVCTGCGQKVPALLPPSSESLQAFMEDQQLEQSNMAKDEANNNATAAESKSEWELEIKQNYNDSAGSDEVNTANFSASTGKLKRTHEQADCPCISKQDLKMESEPTAAMSSDSTTKIICNAQQTVIVSPANANILKFNEIVGSAANKEQTATASMPSVHETKKARRVQKAAVAAATASTAVGGGNAVGGKRSK